MRTSPWAFALLLAAAAAAPAPAARGGDGSEMTPRVEQAISRVHRQLLGQQGADGSFRGGQNVVANTALGLMAFMVQGEFPDHGPYGPALARAVQYLLDVGKRNAGYMAVIGNGMYEHALATLALSEAWGMSQNEGIRDALKEAVAVIVRAQFRNGGWRYKPQPNDHDLSVAAMVMISLLSARESGIHVPAETLDKGLAYVKSMQDKASGGYGYQQPTPPGLGRTGAGTLVRLLAGEKGEGVDAGIAFIEREEPNKFKQTGHYFYAHYYCALAMYQIGDEPYLRYYPQIRDALLARQSGNGAFGEAWQSGYAALILGIPYRYIPIYQRTEFEE